MSPDRRGPKNVFLYDKKLYAYKAFLKYLQKKNNCNIVINFAVYYNVKLNLSKQPLNMRYPKKNLGMSQESREQRRETCFFITVL